MSAASAIPCEIRAPRATQAAALAEIAVACARDIGEQLSVKTLVIGGRPTAAPVLTLRLPAQLAGRQHQTWCLACRLACSCPDSRVSVLVTGAAFSDHAAETRRRCA